MPEIVKEKGAAMIIVCTDDSGGEWYKIEPLEPYSGQLRDTGAYGEFVSRIVETCEACIPLVSA